MVLREWKPEARARLSGSRAALLAALLGLGEGAHSDAARAMLLQLARADERAAGALHDLLRPARTSPGVSAVSREHQPLSLPETLTILHDSRAGLLSVLSRVSGDPSSQEAGGMEPFVINEIEAAIDREEKATATITAQPANTGASPVCLLVLALRAARMELLTEIAMIPDGERADAIILRGERLAGALTRIADRTRELVPAGTAVRADRARREVAGDSWSSTWRHLHDSHADLLRALAKRQRSTGQRELALEPEDFDHDSHAVRVLVEADRALAGKLRQGRAGAGQAITG